MAGSLRAVRNRAKFGYQLPPDMLLVAPMIVRTARMSNWQMLVMTWLSVAGMSGRSAGRRVMRSAARVTNDCASSELARGYIHGGLIAATTKGSSALESVVRRARVEGG